MNNFGLAIVIDYHDKATSNLNKTKEAFRQTWQEAQKMTDGLNSTTAQLLSVQEAIGAIAIGKGMSKFGKGIMGSLKGATQSSMEFEKELNSLRFVTGALDEEMAMFENRALDVSMITQFSPTEVVQGMYELKSAGLDNIAMLESLNATLNLVSNSAGEIELAQGSMLMANTLNKFNLKAYDEATGVNNADRVSDMLAQLTKDTNFHFGEIPAMMNSFGMAPTKSGRPLEEFLATAGLLRNVGQMPAQAGNTVNGLVRKLLDITKFSENEEALSRRPAGQIKAEYMGKLGLNADTIWDLEGNMRSIPDIMTSIIESTATMTDKDRAVAIQALFGDQAGNALYAIESAQKEFYSYDDDGNLINTGSKDGKKDIHQLVESLTNSEGVALEGSNNYLQTLDGRLQLLSGVVEAFKTLVGQSFEPFYKTIVSGAYRFMSVVVDLMRDYPRLTKALAFSIGVIGLLAVAFGTLFTTVGALTIAMPFLKAGLVGVGKIMSNLGMFMLHPIKSIGALATSFKVGLTTMLASMKPFLFAFAKLALTVGMLALIWKTDFMNIRSNVTSFVNGVISSFNQMRDISALPFEEMKVAVGELDRGTFFGGLTYSLLQVRTLAMGIRDIFRDGVVSEETSQQADLFGLSDLLSNLEIAKQNWGAMIEGMKTGFIEFGEAVVEKFSSIREALDNLGFSIDPIIEKLTLLTQTTDEVDVEKYNALGESLGKVAGVIAGLWVAVKVFGIIKTAMKPIIVIASGIKKIILGVIGVFAKLKAGGGLAKVLGGSKVVKVLAVIGKAIAGAIGAIATFLGLPVIAVVAIIAGLTALGIAIYKYRDKIADFFRGIGERISEFWSNFKEGASELGSSIADSFSGIGDFFKGIGDSISEFWGRLKERASELGSSIGDFFRGIGESTGETFSNAWDRVKTFFSDLWGGIKDVASRVGNFFKGIGQLLLGGLMVVAGIGLIISSLIWEGLKAVGRAILDFFKGIGSNIAEFFSPIIESIKGKLSSVWETITTVFNHYMNILVARIIDIGKRIKERWEVIRDSILEVWNNIKERASEVWNSVTEAVRNQVERIRERWNSFKETMSQVWESIKTKASEVWNSITETVSNLVERLRERWNSFKETMNQIWESIKTKASEVWNSIIELVTPIIERLKELWNSFKETMSQIWESIKATAQELWDSIANFAESSKERVESAWQSVVEFFSGIWESMKSTASAFFDWLGERLAWLSSAISDAKEAVASLPGAGIVRGGISLVQKGARAVGLNTGGYVKTEGMAMLHPNEVVVNDRITQMLDDYLTGNLKQGRKEQTSTIFEPTVYSQNIRAKTPQPVSTQGSFKSTASNLADTVTSAIKEALNMNSLSRVITRIGESTVQGLNSIESNYNSNDRTAKGLNVGIEPNYDSVDRTVMGLAKRLITGFNDLSLDRDSVVANNNNKSDTQQEGVSSKVSSSGVTTTSPSVSSNNETNNIVVEEGAIKIVVEGTTMDAKKIADEVMKQIQDKAKMKSLRECREITI